MASVSSSMLYGYGEPMVVVTGTGDPGHYAVHLARYNHRDMKMESDLIADYLDEFRMLEVVQDASARLA